MARPTGGAPAATPPNAPMTAFAALKEVKKSKERNRVSADLAEEVDDDQRERFTKREKRRWAREHRGQRQVQVVVLSDADDPTMSSLRARVAELGGVVQAAYPALRSMTVVMPKRTLRRLARHPDVLNIAPNRETHSTSSQLELITGALSPEVRTYPTATSYSGLDGSGVGIAILDSGVMKAHRNFRNAAGTVSRVVRSVSMLKIDSTVWDDSFSIWGTPQPGSASQQAFDAAVAADNDVQQDPYGHGTHVASVAAGRGFYQSPNSTGMAPGANLIDVRVMRADGTGTVADTLMGINWVIYNARALNIRVMNISLAASSTDPWDFDPLCAAVRAATAAGITVVVAAGNYGNAGGNKNRYGSVASPANDPTVITVGAVNFKASNGRNDDTVTSFSSRGPTRSFMDMGTHKWYDNVIKPDLVAPGNRVVGASATTANPTAPALNGLASKHPQLGSAAGGGTVYAQRVMQLSGTSVAAPAVAGAAAVLLQANPGLTPPLVKAILQYSAQPLAGQSLVDQGAGQLNLQGAVQIARSLRTDISTALRNGTLKVGSTSLLASGRSFPTVRSNSIGGTTVNWSRIVTVGGNRIATGDLLLTRWQPVWDPRLAWASDFAV
jgi:subtilisin family serine protease